MRRARPVGRPGRRRHRPRRLSRRRLRLRHPAARRCRRRTGRATCSSRCCASAARRSSRSRISATGASAALIGLTGRMPVTRNLPYSWYDTPNIHFCTIRDFVAPLRRDACARSRRRWRSRRDGARIRFKAPLWFWNLFGQQAVFLLTPLGPVAGTCRRRNQGRAESGLPERGFAHARRDALVELLGRLDDDHAGKAPATAPADPLPRRAGAAATAAAGSAAPPAPPTSRAARTARRAGAR